MRLYSPLIILLIAGMVNAQTGSINGLIIDVEFNNEPLPFANVVIKGSSIGTTSDFEGFYTIDNLQPGSYTLVFSFVGYETVEVSEVLIEADKITAINLPMKASSASLDQIVITTTTKKESEVALLLEQQKATTIKESIGAQELAQKGVGDAAGAVSKISGISRQEGGNNVYVRGLGDRYLNTTYNGLSLPSNNIEKKNMDLSLFSSDIIQNVSVSKAYASQLYGDFAAGSVNILAKEYKGPFFVDVQLGTGINTRAIRQSFVRSEGTSYFGYYNRYDNNPFAVVLSHGVDPDMVDNNIALNGSISGGKSFTFGHNSDARLSLFMTASFQNDYEYREGTAVDFTTVEKKRFPKAIEYEYASTTSAMANLILKINNEHRLSYNSLFINNASDEVGYFGVEGAGTNRDAILDTDQGFYQMNVQFEQDMVFVNQLLGTHQVAKNLNLQWGFGYNKVYARQPDRKRISIERYNLAFDSDPNTKPTFFNNIPYDNQRYFQAIEDDELNSKIILEYKVSEKLILNLGHNGRKKQRFFENIRYGYDFIEPNTPVNDVFNLNSVFNVANFGNVYNTEVFNSIDSDRGIDNTNFPGLAENTYSGILEIHAGFINAQFKAGDKWLFVPGFRAESFSQKIEYDVINLPPNEVGLRASYENFFLPSLSIRYALNEDSNIRFAFSQTVSNPEFKEVAPFVYEDVTQRIGGNPDLLNDPSFSKIWNLDLKYEWFLSKGELLSVAVFGKQIENPINKVIANDATGTQRYFRTGEKARVLGGEIELRKNILTNQNEDVALSVGLNATYMWTEQDLQNSEGLFSTTFNRDTDHLQGASPLILNADVSYSRLSFTKYKPVANLVFSYFSDRIDALGSGQLGNIIEKAVPTLDFVWKNRVGEHWEVNASAKNLLDPKVERLRENTSQGDVTLSKYQRGINLALQVKFNF
ncbi:MAG: TonB-dependent receptor [Gilvibacter sp.]